MDVEEQLGQVRWEEQPGKKRSNIAIDRPSNITDRTTWPELNAWFVDTIEKWLGVWRPILKSLNASDPSTADELIGMDGMSPLTDGPDNGPVLDP